MRGEALREAGSPAGAGGIDGPAVAVVGGGIGGLSAALAVLRNSDASVALIERAGVGSNDPTPLVFSDTIGRYGLSGHVTARYRRFTFHAPGGARSRHVYDEPPLAALDYRGACSELLERCHAAGRMKLLDGEAVRLARERGKAWTVELRDGRRISASVVVDASGRGLFAAGQLGLPRPRMYSHCFGRLFEGCGAPDPEEAFFLAPERSFGDGGGWFYPLPGGRASFGYAALGPAPSYKKSVRDGYSRALREFRPYADWLAAARPVREETGVIPVFPLRRFAYDGLVLVGDAAGQATIWACMGVEMALAGGQAAGEAVAEAHRRKDYSASSLGGYQRWWDRSCRRIYRQAALMAPLVWRLEGNDWDRNVRLLQRLTPEQMLARLRTNWPPLPLWKVLFVIAYDWAGRTRRALVRRLSGIMSGKGPA